MTWDNHVTQLCTRLSRVLLLLNKLKKLVTDEYLVMAYQGLLHAHIRYGILHWGHALSIARVHLVFTINKYILL